MEPQKSAFLVFEEKPTKRICSGCFDFVSALKTIELQMFFLSVFLKTLKKVIDHQKHHFGRFWLLITFLGGIFKKTDQNNICVYICFKARTKKNKQKSIV